MYCNCLGPVAVVTNRDKKTIRDVEDLKCFSLGSSQPNNNGKYASDVQKTTTVKSWHHSPSGYLRDLVEG